MTDNWVLAWATVALAGATFLLFLAAVVTAIFAAGTWRAAQASNRERDDERRREQASRIAAWAIADKDGYAIILGNPTSEPIYNLHVEVNGYGEIAVKYLVSDDWGIIPPGFRDRVTFVVSSQADRTRQQGVVYGEIDMRGHQSDDFRAEISFEDAAGRRWKRADNGVLTEITYSLPKQRKGLRDLRKRITRWIHAKTAPKGSVPHRF